VNDDSNSITFLHGFLGTAEDWRPIVESPELADWKNDSINLAVPDGSLNSADSWQAGLNAIASQLTEETILVGYSMGARVALGCALDTSKRLRALVLVSGSPGIAEDQKVARKAHDTAIAQRLLGLDSPSQKSDFLDQWYRQPVFADLTEDQIADLVRDRQGFDPERQSRLIRAYTVSKQPDYGSRLAELAVPTLVITGRRDAKYTQIAKCFVERYKTAKNDEVCNRKGSMGKASLSLGCPACRGLTPEGNKNG